MSMFCACISFSCEPIEKVKKTMAKKTFEEALGKLEKLTTQLEEEGVGLEASLKKFDEGIKLAEFCNRKLDEAQKKVNILLKKEGELIPEPFNAHSDDEKE